MYFIRQIFLTVQQLPDLRDDHFYQCIFNDVESSRATKDGNILTCNTPMTSKIPEIPAGNGK